MPGATSSPASSASSSPSASSLFTFSVSPAAAALSPPELVLPVLEDPPPPQPATSTARTIPPSRRRAMEELRSFIWAITRHLSADRRRSERKDSTERDLAPLLGTQLVDGGRRRAAQGRGTSAPP